MIRTIAVALVALVSAGGYAHAQDQAAPDREDRRTARAQMMERLDGIDAAGFAALMEERAATHFDRLDADGDGVISREEFLASVTDRAELRFARLDRNNDGVLTAVAQPDRGAKRAERAERTERAERVERPDRGMRRGDRRAPLE